jgi:hypothetical protein
MWDVPTDVWRRYVPPEQLGHVLCLSCWSRLVEVVDDGTYQRARGGPLLLWSPAWRERHGVPEDEPPPLQYADAPWVTPPAKADKRR